MKRGRVKWFSPEKGYGFIMMDENTQVFVHYTSIDEPGFKMLHSEELVEFELVDTKDGYQARKVRRLGIAADDSRESKEADPSVASRES